MNGIQVIVQCNITVILDQIPDNKILTISLNVESLVCERVSAIALSKHVVDYSTRLAAVYINIVGYLKQSSIGFKVLPPYEMKRSVFAPLRIRVSD